MRVFGVNGDLGYAICSDVKYLQDSTNCVLAYTFLVQLFSSLLFSGLQMLVSIVFSSSNCCFLQVFVFSLSASHCYLNVK